MTNTSSAHQPKQYQRKYGILIFGIVQVIIFSLIFYGEINAQKIPANTYADMQWRLVGPFRAGWATMAAGVTTAPNTFYFGSAGGGVWKTDDAGRTWQPLMQHQSASSIGAIAVAPSNPDILYVGTGQVALRYDILSGNGIYRSNDGGKTWKHVGLDATRHIGRLLIDPHNPNRVLAAAMGNAFKPNSERGVFLTDNGGKNWKRVLYVNNKTGAVDLASDPLYPSIVYAAMWQMQMHPWLDYFTPQIGPGSGIYKSTDGGNHWKHIAGNGIPAGPLGRIGLAVARGSKEQIVYAAIKAPKSQSGLYVSDNGGKSWHLVNSNGTLADSYFNRITVNPTNSKIIYVMGRSIRRSADGGKHFTIIKGAPGGDDYHFLWINPADTTHMITASDQGAVVTVNGGKSWSSWYNQPTGQFYHLAIDNRFPYRIYSGQQDNGTVCILSRGPYGVIGNRDWHPVGGSERDYEIPKPGNPNIVFGTGLGGSISRFNQITRQVTNVSPWPISSYGDRLNTVRYRYTWITPLAFSPLGLHPMYFGAQVLFKSLDDGNHWKVVSPDLSGKITDRKDITNPDLTQARSIGYGVIYTIAPSPIAKKVIWIGTDDGLIWLTTDNGNHWHNVTPPTVPLWARIDAVSPSAFSSKTAYTAVNTHRLGKLAPLIIKTTDNGKNWQTIIHGIPSNEYVNVVRADPVRKGLLYAGTNRSVYVSFNSGEQWYPLTLNLPTTSIRDLLLHEGDLIAATQGRGIWILDDIKPLREINVNLEKKSVYLFSPAKAWRIRSNENRDTPFPPSTPYAQNPPAGAIIDYWLKSDVHNPIKLTFRDSKGNIVRSFSSNTKQKALPVNRYFEKTWLGKTQKLSVKAGMHRFVWNLRYKRPGALSYHYSIAAVWGKSTPVIPQGLLILPGRYTVTLSVNGKNYSKPLYVKLDPRVHVSYYTLKKQLQFALKVDKELKRSISAHNEIVHFIKEKKGELSSIVIDSLSALAYKGHPNLASVSGVLTNAASIVQTADAAPTQGQRELFVHSRYQINKLLAKWHKVKKQLLK